MPRQYPIPRRLARPCQQALDTKFESEGQESLDESEQPFRLWLFQCKRERELGPTAVKKIVREGMPKGGDVPHGYILAAACDFSKKARDAFHLEALTVGVRAC